MTDKSLKDKAINIKGKEYVQVSDRVAFFNENYEKGSITTELVSSPESQRVIIKATVYPESGLDRVFTGYSQAVIGEGMVNKTAALENAETSAVGRALGFMGIGVIESIASSDEIYKATSAPQKAQISPMANSNPVLALKAKLEKLGATNEAEALELIENKSGVKVDKFEDINNVKAKGILELFTE